MQTHTNSTPPTTPTETPKENKGHKIDATIALARGAMPYSAEGDWITLRKNEKPVAEMYFTAYTKTPAEASRPVTFVFNGGPGAASAYLHLGALGPKRVAFQDDGAIPPPPASLADNTETWLEFTDLVFIDPIGTGFSRAIDDPKPAEADKAKHDDKSGERAKDFYQVNRDLDSLCEFIRRYLTRAKRWASPVYIAGESYGGYRVGRLARRLQEHGGVGLSGAILISPAMEIGLLNATDYDIHRWVDVFPSMVATAHHHGKSKMAEAGTPVEKVLKQAEDFATSQLAKFLLLGEAMEAAERQAVMTKIAAYTGLELDFVMRKQGRISELDFARWLFKKDHKFCGMYDGSVTAVDPFPDRDGFVGPDPTLFSIDRVFSGGANHLIREWLGVETPREYTLLSMDVNQAWRFDEKKHAFELMTGATDDLRYGMALNPHMKVFLTHGFYDLVTPYYSANRLLGLMKLTPEQRAKVTIEHYKGGHMFYTWKTSRMAFRDAIRAFMSK